jgi:hypothetical protein
MLNIKLIYQFKKCLNKHWLCLEWVMLLWLHPKTHKDIYLKAFKLTMFLHTNFF